MMVWQYSFFPSHMMLPVRENKLILLMIKSFVTQDTRKYCSFSPLYTGGLFHCCMLDKSICHFRGVESILSLILFHSIFDGKSC